MRLFGIKGISVGILSALPLAVSCGVANNSDSETKGYMKNGIWHIDFEGEENGQKIFKYIVDTDYTLNEDGSIKPHYSVNGKKFDDAKLAAIDSKINSFWSEDSEISKKMQELATGEGKERFELQQSYQDKAGFDNLPEVKNGRHEQMTAKYHASKDINEKMDLLRENSRILGKYSEKTQDPVLKLAIKTKIHDMNLAILEQYIMDVQNDAQKNLKDLQVRLDNGNISRNHFFRATQYENSRLQVISELNKAMGGQKFNVLDTTNAKGIKIEDAKSLKQESHRFLAKNDPTIANIKASQVASSAGIRAANEVTLIELAKDARAVNNANALEFLNQLDAKGTLLAADLANMEDYAQPADSLRSRIEIVKQRNYKKDPKQPKNPKPKNGPTPTGNDLAKADDAANANLFKKLTPCIDIKSTPAKVGCISAVSLGVVAAAAGGYYTYQNREMLAQKSYTFFFGEKLAPEATSGTGDE